MLERVLALGDGMSDFEFSGEAPGAPGILHRWLAAFFPVRTGAGAIDGVGIILRDITGAVRGEDAANDAGRGIRRRCIR